MKITIPNGYDINEPVDEIRARDLAIKLLHKLGWRSSMSSLGDATYFRKNKHDGEIRVATYAHRHSEYQTDIIYKRGKTYWPQDVANDITTAIEEAKENQKQREIDEENEE